MRNHLMNASHAFDAGLTLSTRFRILTYWTARAFGYTGRYYRIAR